MRKARTHTTTVLWCTTKSADCSLIDLYHYHLSVASGYCYSYKKQKQGETQ